MRVWALAFAAAALATACRPDAKSAGTDPFAKKVAETVPGIEKGVGLKFKQPPRVETRSKEEVRSFLEHKFEEESPARELVGMEAAYKRLGLLPDTMQLRKFMLELLAEQVVGYYDPATKVLYIVNGASEEAVGITLTHELVHALQDQYVNLDSLQKRVGDNDRETAAQSFMEGQATYEQLQLMAGTNFVGRLGGWDRIRELIRENQSAMPVFATAPTLIQETLIFPYLSGAEFVKRMKEQHPGENPFTRLPLSTEQVMHAPAYEGRDTPTRITLPPLPAGLSKIYENDLGEFETRLFLFEHLQDRETAVRGAIGWDGDRYVLWKGAGGEGIAWVTVWDTAIDAGEYFTAMDGAIKMRYSATVNAGATESVKQYSGFGRAVRLVTAEIGGRPVVLYVDVPKGASTDVISLSKVGLAQK